MLLTFSKYDFGFGNVTKLNILDQLLLPVCMLELQMQNKNCHLWINMYAWTGVCLLCQSSKCKCHSCQITWDRTNIDHTECYWMLWTCLNVTARCVHDCDEGQPCQSIIELTFFPMNVTLKPYLWLLVNPVSFCMCHIILPDSCMLEVYIYMCVSIHVY